ncbi:hypothetical protein [Paenibacillus sedimenti]|uniref:hypothetical protein n=1 Tax=Paenibacillus sedimenti TaxID=2770274 RepID=UPI00165F3868|nr:hypothetical protein [Paenibacillus sedimenti]
MVIELIIKNDLKELTSNHVKLEKLYKSACGMIEITQDKHTTELKRVEKRLSQLQNEFQKLFQAYSQSIISLEQFQAQNQLIIAEQNSMNQRKADLEKQVGERDIMEEQLKDFKKQVSKVARLDFDNEQILKIVIHRVVQKIEISDTGTVKEIHYNFINPLSHGT